MSYVEDRWYRTVAGADGKPVKTPTIRVDQGLRYRARWFDGPGAERSKSFRRKIDADQFLEKLETRGCLVLECKRISVTEEPVMLCDDHRDLFLARYAAKPSGVHAPLVYFACMGTRVKIGWTTNLRRRMSAMSLPASCVAIKLDGGPELEDRLHKRFAASRIRGSEWFEVTPELQKYMDEKRAIADAAAESERRRKADEHLKMLIAEQLARESGEEESVA